MKYIYNPATLRYDRAKISLLSVGSITVGLVLFGAFFFVGLGYVQNYLVETPLEKSLRAENKALDHYRVELAAQLDLAKDQMTALESKDKSLYQKIFETKKTDRIPAVNAQADKEILLADAPAFHHISASLLAKFVDINLAARASSIYFGETARVKKKDIAFLISVPSYTPLADFDAAKLVSGYGIRINPFHKRNYHHDGIDLAGPRGSEVLAAAPGLVTAVSYSDLQAGFGNYVEIDHANGYVTRYANLGEITVRYGQKMSKGQPIGRLGISGGSVAPHVHYEVLKHGRNLDPVKFLMHGLNANQYDLVWVASNKQNQSLD